jgi:hypothetical protein
MEHRATGAASCPDVSCECPSCLVSMVVNNELIFFRKYSDPSTRKGEEPRYVYNQDNWSEVMA